jgi:hypothetical protein
MKKPKQIKIKANDIKRLIPDVGYCFASDMITVKKKKVGYMYREKPNKNTDSGWRFFSGDEDQEYVDNPDNLGLFEVNTIANYDPDIIPYLNSPFGAAFGRDLRSGQFVQEELHPLED